MEEEHDEAERGEAAARKSWWCWAIRRTTASPASRVEEERDLSDAYRRRGEGDGALKPQGQGLNDLYIRFFRMAERCIVEKTRGKASSASSPTIRGWTACRSR